VLGRKFRGKFRDGTFRDGTFRGRNGVDPSVETRRDPLIGDTQRVVFRRSYRKQPLAVGVWESRRDFQGLRAKQVGQNRDKTGEDKTGETQEDYLHIHGSKVIVLSVTCFLVFFVTCFLVTCFLLFMVRR
jgi:hypothetical protein